VPIPKWLSTANWSPLGPAPADAPGVGLGLAAGRLEAIAPDPSDVDTTYVGANNGGVWKTGVWTFDPPVRLALTDNQPSLQAGAYSPSIQLNRV
jgi:hypothetical protein